jgi:imidazoleglycerol-phosphate dehydratase
MSRSASIERKTSESSVKLSLNLDGSGKSKINTTVPFYDHLLTALAKHSMIDLEIEASGDTEIDIHHTVEDTAIVLGQALKKAMGDKAGIARYGDATVPLDDALVRAVVDLSGRPYLSHTGEPAGFEFHAIGGHFTGSLVRHVFEAICLNADITVHINVLDGRDPHHIAETEFKAFARALRKALEHDPRVIGIPSTKGAL